MARSIAVWIWVSATLFAFLHGIECATFEILNQCSYTVWAAASPGGGSQLEQGQSWTIQVPAGTSGKIWGRTGCSFDGSGRGNCTTGGCGVLSCQGHDQGPATLAEYALNQYQNLDFFDISLVDGFNLPLSMTPSSENCRRTACLSDVNKACPNELRVKDGCKSACAQFNTAEYCCTGASANNCAPTKYSKFFKGQCPDAYSYAKDDQSSTFTCPGGTNYKIVFCGEPSTNRVIMVLIDVTILDT